MFYLFKTNFATYNKNAMTIQTQSLFSILIITLLSVGACHKKSDDWTLKAIEVSQAQLLQTASEIDGEMKLPRST